MKNKKDTMKIAMCYKCLEEIELSTPSLELFALCNDCAMDKAGY